jgi:hypothetical protein
VLKLHSNPTICYVYIMSSDVYFLFP